MPVVRHADARRTTTPNATMTTHASPTQGGSAQLAVWTVEMTPGAAGPPHTFDVEQVWTVLDGRVRADVDDEHHDLGPGDVLVLPAGAVRRVHAVDAFRAVVAAPAGARATPVDGEPVLPPWIA
ncbi:cupin domain-containing protein [Pseudonocardia oceani]|uniref:Cupin domain-containing protein n=4 Tax=Pseudonocardia oceani TaxID=2792013 RepID=A0ABS6U4A9_9PSEU|nr:cupin domain-containing protein [Pseudonocardia oceani]MBW0124436.1 cupin domain-containing protein [Pseudonocardia oceani]MBW0126793.1 cupin domain-containing protein [Pseudonocardia oceani]